MELSPTDAKEYWQTGPVAGIPAMLQPVAHTLLQVNREIKTLLPEIDQETLWEKPGGLASAGFHLVHMAGVLDRLFTYAYGSMLNAQQLRQLASEDDDAPVSPAALAEKFSQRTELALRQLADTDPDALTGIRFAGRKKIPTTQIGLLFHAAEHLMRHMGQLMVTVRLSSKSGL